MLWLTNDYRFMVTASMFVIGFKLTTTLEPFMEYSSAVNRVNPTTLGGWNEKTNLDVVRTIHAILDELRPREHGGAYSRLITFVKDRLGHDRRYAIDAYKIEHELGWRPEETFETGIRKTVQWY